MNDIIEYFVHTKGMAVVGVSDKKFGGTIYKTLKKKGYRVYPVHPTRELFDGDKCFPDLNGVPPEVKAAVIAVSPESAVKVVDDAAVSGFTHLWFQDGKDFSDAQDRANKKGIKTVSKKCILMYAQPVTGIHAFHRFLAKLFGKL